MFKRLKKSPLEENISKVGEEKIEVPIVENQQSVETQGETSESRKADSKDNSTQNDSESEDFTSSGTESSDSSTSHSKSIDSISKDQSPLAESGKLETVETAPLGKFELDAEPRATKIGNGTENHFGPDIQSISTAISATPPGSGKSRVQFVDVPLEEVEHSDLESDQGMEPQQLDGSTFVRPTFFSDNARLIDFVLVYLPTNEDSMTERTRVLYRERFEDALKQQGLDLEHVKPEATINGKTAFVKIHSPFPVLQRQAELMNLRKAFMESDIRKEEPSWFGKVWQKITKRPFALQEEYRLPKKDQFSESFERDRRHEFLNHEDEVGFFTSAERVYLTWDVISKTTIKLEEEKEHNPLMNIVAVSKSKLKRLSLPKRVPIATEKVLQSNADQLQTEETKIDQQPSEEDVDNQENEECDDDHENHDDQINSASFQMLQEMEVYQTAFPIHDSEMNDKMISDQLSASEWPSRKYLYESWARLGQWRRHQPLQSIRDYYGDKMAMYFAFIGFYTKMLILPSVVGLLVTIYGIYYLVTDTKSEIICKDKPFGSLTMCPDCPTSACTFTRVRSFCVMSKINAIFDNNITIFFSIFISVWAVCFLECWKRYRSKLCAEWNLSELDEEADNIRFDYIRHAPDVKLNPVTMQLEPHIKRSYRMKRILASVSTVIFFICVVISSVIGIMLYKVVGQKWWKRFIDGSGRAHGHRSSDVGLIVSITASVANGVFIALATWVYTKIAWFLTKAETHRTDREFEEAYIYKVFIFQCVNFYAALFYLAFYRSVRLVFANAPHEQNLLDTRCSIAGCLVEVTIQLAIIFVGKQAINNFLEIGKPLLHFLWKKLRMKREEAPKVLPAWESNYLLEENEKCLLFSDYLELLIQYGFVTMFVAAFPLAPLFAFLNNIIEIRLDAYKNVVFTRRCVPYRTNDIAPWYGFLETFTKLAVLTNALVIAFTTNVIVRMVYGELEDVDVGWDYRFPDWHTSHNVTNLNVTDPKYDSVLFQLSIYNTSDYSVYSGKSSDVYSMAQSEDPQAYCYFVGYRNPPDDVQPYSRRMNWWYVLGSRLLFVVLFENAIFIFQAILAYLIPDVPSEIETRTAREKYLVRINFLRREFGIREDEERVIIEEPQEDAFDRSEFVPDELPIWLSTENQNETNGTAQRRNSHPLAGKRGQRGKMINPQRKKQPFLIMIFKKLMLCN